MRWNKIARNPTLAFEAFKEYIYVENFDELFKSAVDGMRLIEEKDWDLPWPTFDKEVDLYAPLNLKIYEVDRFSLPDYAPMKAEYEKRMKEEESKSKINALLKKKKTQLKRLFRLCFKRNEDIMCRKVYNSYTRNIVAFIHLLGFSRISNIQVSVGIFIFTL